MKRGLIEIRKALDEELYYCALALTLTLPDICGKIEYPNEKCVHRRYTNWFNSYAKQYFTRIAHTLPENGVQEYVWLSAEECYALRCAYLHSGNYDLSESAKLKDVHLHTHTREGKSYIHMVKDKHYADWDVIDLCNNICNAVDDYCSSHLDKDMIVDEIRIDVW